MCVCLDKATEMIIGQKVDEVGFRVGRRVKVSSWVERIPKRFSVEEYEQETRNDTFSRQHISKTDNLFSCKG